jgi:putative SOS response-associated peptidase YedK
MCGRYERHSDKQRIADAFKVGKLPPGFELPPDYNVGPKTPRLDFQRSMRERRQWRLLLSYQFVRRAEMEEGVVETAPFMEPLLRLAKFDCERLPLPFY